MKVDFNSFLTEEYLKDVFRRRISPKNGGGRDNLTPDTYWKHYESDTSLIIQKITRGIYKFTPYNEQLILKGRNKLPRVISVPTIRDKWVLSALNEYLQHIFEESVNHHIPNYYIKRVKDYIALHKEEHLNYLKTDFQDFFNTIDHQILIGKLKERITDDRIIKLIKDAIQTPTISKSEKYGYINVRGVPQGLPISNILVEIYLNKFDSDFERLGAGLYLRYVDDILFIQPHFDNLKKIVVDYIKEEKLNLKLSEEKTFVGKIDEKNALDFIGYLIYQDRITIRSKNINNHLLQVASICTKFKTQYKLAFMRPKFLKDDNEFVEFYIEELNRKISGIKYKSRLYGWLPYFRQVTDISLFYRLDNILRNKFLGNMNDVNLTGLHTYVDSYFSIIGNQGRGLIVDMDNINDVDNKKFFLYRKGWLDDKEYTNEQIDRIYDRYCKTQIRKEEKNIGYVN